MARRVFSASVVLVLVLSFVIACGGDDDDETPPAAGATPTTAPAPTGTSTGDGSASGTPTSAGAATSAPTMTDATPTEAAEPTATTAAAATETPTAAATEPPAESTATNVPSGDEVTPDEQRLLDLLLSEDEALAILGVGWMETSRGPVAEDDGDSVGICGAADFPRKDEKIAHVQADWSTEDNNSISFENIVEFPDGVIDEAMQYLRDSVSCTEWTDTDGSVATVAPWDNPELADLGDETIAIIVTTEVNGAPVDIYAAFVRTGNLITQIIYADLTATDTAEVELVALDMVGTAMEKIEAGM